MKPKENQIGSSQGGLSQSSTLRGIKIIKGQKWQKPGRKLRFKKNIVNGSSMSVLDAGQCEKLKPIQSCLFRE